jgi:rod shape-determining protein MreD
MPRLSVWGITPDLVLLVVVSWSLLRGIGRGLPMGLFGGLILELISGGPFGGVILSLLAASAATTYAHTGISRDSVWLPLAAGSLATVLYIGLYGLVLRASGRPVDLALGLLQIMVPSVALNVIAMYPIYWLLRRLHQRTVFGQAA